LNGELVELKSTEVPPELLRGGGQKAGGSEEEASKVCRVCVGCSPTGFVTDHCVSNLSQAETVLGELLTPEDVAQVARMIRTKDDAEEGATSVTLKVSDDEESGSRRHS
jgi:hypothetical protein